MKTNSLLTYALLWLSKTDPAIYNQNPQNVKWSRTNLGIFVLLTGVFAFITATFFIRSLFIELDPLTNQIRTPFIGWVIGAVFGLFWAMFIIAMDREIVASNSKGGAIVRIGIALFIGYIISLPVKVMFFQSTIKKELTQVSRIENASVNTRYLNENNRLTGQIQQLEKDVAFHRSEMARFANLKFAEGVGLAVNGSSGKAGEGIGFRTANENVLLHEKLAADTEKQLEKAKQNFEKNLTVTKDEYLSNHITQSFDFPAQLKALNEILDRPENRSLYWFAMFLMVIFMAVEAMPAFMKLIREKDEYDGLLSVRTVVNLHFMNKVANDNMDKIESSPSVAFINPGSNSAPVQILKTINQNLN